MNKSNLRLKKLIKLRKILFNKRISHLSKTLTAVVLAVVSPTVASNKQGSNFNNDFGDRKIDHKEWLSYTTIKHNSMSDINWEEEINQRTDWLMQEYVDTLKSSLNEIMGIKQYKERRNYISKNFFDKVYSAGHLRMANFYCVAGAMSCLSRVNDETGDLDGFFPDATTTEANAMVSCPGFAAYVKKNYKDCLKEYLYAKNRKMVTKAGDVLEVDKLKPGMLLLQVSSGNTSSGWHAVVYIGDGKVASFNRDGIYNIKTNIKTKVIDIPEIVRIGWRERVKKMQNMQKNVNGNEMASVFTDLYSGREAEFVNKFEKANIKDNLFMYHPIALDERTFNIAAEKEGLEVVNLSSPQEGKKTVMPWMLFSKIAGKNLDKI